MQSRLLVLIIAGLLAGCAVPSHVAEKNLKTNYFESAPQPNFEFSLFKGDQEVMKNEDLNKILSTELKLPDKIRVAVLKLPSKHGSYYYWSEVYHKTEQEYIKTFSSILSTSDRVGKVTFLPMLITPKDASISVLREAAARLQADVLIVFQITSNIYSEYKLFDKDSAKAHSTCEAVLLDVRTGIVPFTTIDTKDFLAVQEKTELNLGETMQRAEREAVLASLNAISSQIVDFLKGRARL